MATADITIIGPRTGPDSHAGEYIAELQRRLASQDKVSHRLHGMGTSLEGSVDDILALVAELHRVPFELDVPRIYTVLKLDDPDDRTQSPDDTVRSV